ncbi:MAG: hypothetical protein V4787_26310 [Pseudomonadota bacterium]
MKKPSIALVLCAAMGFAGAQAPVAPAATSVEIVNSTADADARITLHPDGTAVGVVYNKQGHGSSPAVGTWWMEASGTRCVDVQLPAFRMNWKQCGIKA